MKQLWHQAIGLLRKHPVLFGPAVISAAAGFWVGSYNRRASKIVVGRMMTHTVHSAMGGMMQSTDPNVSTAKLMTAWMSVSFLFRLVENAFFITAFFVTANLVWKYLVREKRRRKTRLVPVLWLAFLIDCIQLAMSLLVISGQRLPGADTVVWVGYALQWTFQLGVVALTAFLMAPLLLQALPMRQAPSKETVSLARKMYFLLALVSTVLLGGLSFLVIWKVPHANQYVSLMSVHVVAALPSAVLFTVLGLLAMQETVSDVVPPVPAGTLPIH